MLVDASTTRALPGTQPYEISADPRHPCPVAVPKDMERGAAMIDTGGRINFRPEQIEPPALAPTEKPLVAIKPTWMVCQRGDDPRLQIDLARIAVNP